MDPSPVVGFVFLVTTPLHRLAFGEQLRDLRRAQGWSSQEAFAHHLGLDRTYVSGIERGARNPTLDIIVQLSHGLGLRPVELLATLDSRCPVHEDEPTLMCRACRADGQGWLARGSARLHDPSTSRPKPATPTGKRP